MHIERNGRPNFSEILARQYQGSKPLDVAVVYPCDGVSLRGAVLAARRGAIRPLLIGPEERINELAGVGGLDIEDIDIHDVEYDFEAAEVAARMARSGEVAAIMKGSLHTDVLMRAIVAREAGLRTPQRMSHVFAVDHPGYHKLLLVTDAAINMTPTLREKRDIVQNAIDLFLQIGDGTPRVAILSAVETVTTKIPSTIEAAALCKMADRGQITGGILDGPLAFDNAIDPEAARIKGIRSEVAGRGQILVVPNLEAGNMLAKNLIFLSNADAAGLVLGARVPVILTSRADSVRTRMASCAIASLSVNARRFSTALPVA